MAYGRLDSQELANRVVVVTGGSRGIGREIALAAAGRGACVAFCYAESVDEAAGVVAEANAMGNRRVMAIRSDVSCDADVARLFAAAERELGSIDVVVNNAGISRSSLLVNQTTEAWDQVIATNLTGCFLTSRAAVGRFANSGRRGTIIHIGSVTMHGAPSDASYAASKGGLAGLNRAIARDYSAQGIRSFLLVGGYVETALTAGAQSLLSRMAQTSPLKRTALAGEFASAVVFLASERSRGLSSGSALYVSGGMIDPAAD